MGLIVQLIGVLGPLITQIIQDHFDQTGEIPTAEQVQKRFLDNNAKYLAEGAEWRQQHPRT